MPCPEPRFPEWMAGVAAAPHRKEEECLVLENRTTDNAAKVILPLLWFRQTIEVRKPVIGVEHAIPKIFEQRAMKSVGSGACHNRNLTPGFGRTPEQTMTFEYETPASHPPKPDCLFRQKR